MAAITKKAAPLPKKKKKVTDFIKNEVAAPKAEQPLESSNNKPNPEIPTLTFGNSNVAEKVEFGGKTISGQEFDDLQRGRVSPQLQDLQKLRERTILKNHIDKKLKEGALIEDVIAELLNQQGGTQSSLAPEVRESILNETEESSFKLKKQFVAPDSFSQKFANSFGVNVPQQTLGSAAKEAGDVILTPIAKIYDFVNSLFDQGKGIEQREAEQTFKSINGDIAQDLSLVSMDLKDPEDVRKKIKLGRAAVSRLKESVHGLGRYNLYYFLTEGKGVETQIALFEDDLRDYENQLNNALLQRDARRLQDVRARYGL